MMMMHQLMYSEIIILDANIHLKVEIYRACEAVVRGESRQKQQASALTREQIKTSCSERSAGRVYILNIDFTNNIIS